MAKQEKILLLDLIFKKYNQGLFALHKYTVASKTLDKIMSYEIINKVLGRSNDSAKSYPSALPPELSKWCCYLRDNGHSILCLHQRNKVQAFEDESAITDFMLPIPVKTVLRNYAVENNFVIVDVEYSSEIGLIIPDEDKEF